MGDGLVIENDMLVWEAVGSFLLPFIAMPYPPVTLVTIAFAPKLKVVCLPSIETEIVPKSMSALSFLHEVKVSNEIAEKRI